MNDVPVHIDENITVMAIFEFEDVGHKRGSDEGGKKPIFCLL